MILVKEWKILLKKNTLMISWLDKSNVTKFELEEVCRKKKYLQLRHIQVELYKTNIKIVFISLYVILSHIYLTPCLNFFFCLNNILIGDLT